MRIAITGASGFVGTALVPSLLSDGHEVIRLVRGVPRGAEEHRWDPEAGIPDLGELGPVDAVIHLAAENLAARRWSPTVKARILESRANPTRALAASLARASVRPRVLISASAIGYYGNRGDAPLTETSGPGEGFLSEVCQAWEAAADPARAAGIRVVHPRFGVILDRRGGALGAMLLPFRLGVGGRLGSGTQYFSWVSMKDVLDVVGHMLVDDRLEGPVNVTAPNPVTNAEFTRTLGHVLHRPAVIPVPGFALRALIGEIADAELLGGKRVLPAALEAAGYRFRHPDLEGALRAALGRVNATPAA